MIKRLTFGLCVSAILSHSSPARAQVETMSGAPVVWDRQPSAGDFGQVFHFFGLSRGGARVECTISSQRRPHRCEVLEEQGPGDGRRAIEIAERYRAESKDRDGLPSIGRKVWFNFDFKIAPGQGA